MEDRIKAKGAMIEKIELKNAQLKGQRAKLSQRVAQKEELCDMLHVVDFEQLQIENQQCLERVDAKNRELLDVKVTTGSTVQARPLPFPPHRSARAVSSPCVSARLRTGRLTRKLALALCACAWAQRGQSRFSHSAHACAYDGHGGESDVQALNAIKAELSELLAAQARLERERRERATQLATFAADFKAADEERRAAEALIRRLTLEQQDTDQPHILDYIRLKHDNMVRAPPTS